MGREQSNSKRVVPAIRGGAIIDRALAGAGWLPVFMGVIVVLVYAGSLADPFVFDDHSYIVQDEKIHSMSSMGSLLGGSTRPVHYLLLAVNYATAGLNPWDYHLTSVLVHLSAVLILYALVLRTLCLPGLRDEWGRDAQYLAFAVAMIWGLHPLLTESVTYVWQRSEALAGLFYLLTLYCFLRGVPERCRFWRWVTIPVCLLGMGSKEIMVTAPIMVLIYDRTFVSGSFARALRDRRGLYAGLAATWLLLAGLLLAYGGSFHANRGVGFNSTLFTPGGYALTMPSALLHYLRLAILPYGLCIDYAWLPVRRTVDILLTGIPVLGLLGLTLWALCRRPGAGFPGVWFFLILAPTSSVMPLPDPVVEHRMYLPLIGIVVLVVMSVYQACLHLIARPAIRAGVFPVMLFGVLLLLGFGTWRRNREYRDERILWRRTLVVAPHNPRAHYNLARAHAAKGEYVKAIEGFDRALCLAPNMAKAHYSRGIALLKLADYAHAADEFRQTLELSPGPEVRFNLGYALEMSGRKAEAERIYLDALAAGRENVRLQCMVRKALERLMKNSKSIGQTGKSEK